MNPQPTSTHRSDIDGLRAVAVLAVLGFHTATPGFSGGFVGVDVFFAISGFLICGILLRELQAGRFSLARFYQRRAKRILPALLAVLLTCMAAALLVLSPYETVQLARNVIATVLSFSNIAFWLHGNYFDPSGMLNPLLMTWSLAVEEQFYIVFPLLLLLAFRRNLGAVFALTAAGCAASFLLCIYLETRHPSPNFYLPFPRAWELGAGCLLAILQSHWQPKQIPPWLRHGAGSLGLLAIAACIFLYTPATRFPGYEALPVIGGTLLLLAFPGSIASRLLSLRPLTGIGLISYSLYLWHWPLLSFAAILTGNASSARLRIVLMVLASILATASYFFIETPFRSTRSQSPSRTLLSYAVAIVAMLTLAGIFLHTHGVAVRVPVLAQVEADLDLDRPHPCIRFADKAPDLSAFCIPPPTPQGTVALLGDSHAEAIASTLRGQVEHSGRKLLVLTAYACPPLRGITRSLPSLPQHAADCARFNQQAFHLVSTRPDVKTVVLLGSWAMLPEDHFTSVASIPQSTATDAANLIQGLTAEVQALQAAGKQVLLIDDWPSLDLVPLDTLSDRYLPLRRTLATFLRSQPIPDPATNTRPRANVLSPAAEQVHTALQTLARANPDLHLVDTKQIVCTATRCTFAEGSHLLYTDAVHMSRYGAERILAGTSIP